jgi:hypothetical protein
VCAALSKRERKKIKNERSKKMELKKSSSTWRLDQGRYIHTVKYAITDTDGERCDERSTVDKIAKNLHERGYISELSDLVYYIAYTAGKGNSEPNYWFIVDEFLPIKQTHTHTAFTKEPENIEI